MALTQTLQDDPSAENYLSEEGIKRKRALAESLMQQASDTSPIRSPWQGVARLAQGLMGGFHEGMANAAEKENNDYNSTLMNKVFGMPRLAPETGSGPSGDVSSGTASNSDVSPNIQSAIFTAADKYGVPRQIALAMAKQESSNNPNAPHGGLFQITKGTASQPGYGVQPVDYNSLSDPSVNSDFAMRYLTARNKGINWNDPNSVDKALASYNGGGDTNYVQHVRRHIPQENAAPVQVASNSPSQAFLLSREARKQDAQTKEPQPQMAQAQPSRAQQILAAMSDPRITPQNRQILTQLYTDAVKNEERYAAPYMDDYGNLIQKDPSGKVNVLHASPAERDSRTNEQKNYEYLNAHPEAKEYFEQTKQFKPGRHVVGGALIDDNGNEIYKAKGVGPSLTPDAIKFGGEQLARGDKSVLANLGRGAQGAENVTALRNEAVNYALAHNIDPRKAMDAAAEYMGQQAGERTLGTQEANAMTAGTEASNALLIGRGANAALPRGNFVPVNQAVQAWQSGNSDPRLAKFGQAMATIANTYARAVNPKGLPHEAVVSDTLKRLSSAQGPEALNAILDVMQQEIDLAEKSPNQAREIIKENRAMRNGDKPEKPSAGVTSSGLKWSIE